MVMGGNANPIDFSNDLTIAISRLTTAQESWARSFGELGDSGNQWWTIFARVTSGSGLWKLQNRIRAVSNVFQAFTENSDKQRKVMMEGLEANLKLGDSMKKLKQAHSDLQKGIGKNNLVEMLVGQGATKKQAKKKVLDYYKGTIRDIGKQQTKEGKRLKKSLLPSMGERYNKMLEKTETTKVQDFVTSEIMSPFTKMQDMFFGEKGSSVGDMLEKGNWQDAMFGDTKKRRGFKTQMGRVKDKIFKSAGKIMPALGKYITMGVAVLGKFLMWGIIIVLGITVLAAIIKKGWPTLSKFVESSGKNFKKVGEAVLGILIGVFRLVKAIFGGKPMEALRIFFFEIFLNVVKLIGNLLIGVMKILLGLITMVIAGIIRIIVDALGGVGRFFGLNKGSAKMPSNGYVQGMHTGGLVRRSGMFNVGEKGKETVMLPRGSRVYNTEQSRNLGGNTIHVHVNGRVGASDSEIKDIANKVAREINLRMNRTGSNRIGA